LYGLSPMQFVLILRTLITTIFMKGCENLNNYLLELKEVSKHFPGVQALSRANLKLRHGTVHALMGENGAGKSTLMKCLLGIYRMDEGEIYINGEQIKDISVNKMRSRGLSIIQQELSPVCRTALLSRLKKQIKISSEVIKTAKKNSISTKLPVKKQTKSGSDDPHQ
jgi:ABC-type sugar transport system ATPase subunit